MLDTLQAAFDPNTTHLQLLDMLITFLALNNLQDDEENGVFVQAIRVAETYLDKKPAWIKLKEESGHTRQHARGPAAAPGSGAAARQPNADDSNSGKEKSALGNSSSPLLSTSQY
ncbi:hypothetical protein FRB90_003358 [Tulasnella sp. 427]|nr:hypothetical protein FRB90_003358 [Tulasnella sp. 427]